MMLQICKTKIFSTAFGVAAALCMILLQFDFADISCMMPDGWECHWMFSADWGGKDDLRTAQCLIRSAACLEHETRWHFAVLGVARETGNEEFHFNVSREAAYRDVARLPLSESRLFGDAPRVQREPLPSTPFIFYHLRKCGGSSLRRTLHRSVLQRNATDFIPCETKGVPCSTYSLDMWSSKEELTSVSVAAGHFSWGTLQTYLNQQSRVPAGIVRQKQRHNTACFTQLRLPIARILSCYNFRFLQESRYSIFGNRSLHDFSKRELRDVLHLGKDQYGHGCANEIVRIFSGYTDENEILDLHMNSVEAQAIALGTKRHLNMCVIGLLEDQLATRAILSHFFPWIDIRQWEHLNSGKSRSKSNVDAMPAENLAVLKHETDFEMRLYRHALRRHVLQLDEVCKARAERNESTKAQLRQVFKILILGTWSCFLLLGVCLRSAANKPRGDCDKLL
eukprot:TRINITY_DN41778_c0_g1_i1.p1 TRINITY_DN41778_c0_g1~~TRINITY_DN41778_c0_g1_i1.p1  ORF type:complete len:467 (+),score=39.79 TRINITY_DN41778_c0_g1_i1:46-1401(+)